MESKTALAANKFKEIENLVERALDAPNKGEAKFYIDRLEFLGKDISQYTGCVFGEMVAYVKEATGRVSNKEKKADIARQSLCKLYSFGVEDEEG